MSKRKQQGWFEDIMVEQGANGSKCLGVRRVENPDNRECGYYGRRELTLTAPIELQKAATSSQFRRAKRSRSNAGRCCNDWRRKMSTEFPNYADKLAQSFAPKGNDPYSVFEREYWNVSPDVACVDEINEHENGCVVVCDTSDANKSWIESLAKQHNFKVTAKACKSPYGDFIEYTITT